MIPRLSPIRRSKPRRGPLRDRAYLSFLRAEGECEACATRLGHPGQRIACKGMTHLLGCDPAHGPVNGMSSKGPDDGCIPLGRVHHEEQTRMGWPAFEKKYRFRREERAKVWFTLYLTWKGNGKSWALKA